MSNKTKKKLANFVFAPFLNSQKVFFFLFIIPLSDQKLSISNNIIQHYMILFATLHTDP